MDMCVVNRFTKCRQASKQELRVSEKATAGRSEGRDVVYEGKSGEMARNKEGFRFT